MKRILLTSNNLNNEDSDLNFKNRFVEKLRKEFKDKSIRGVFICSSPDEFEINDKYLNIHKDAFIKNGFKVDSFILIDNRNKEKVNELIKSTNYLFLCGGHVPTQNEFFKSINLKEEIKEFNGLIVGLSAGSMNSAEVVYSVPELKEEAKDDNFEKYLPGLGLTNINIIPHFNYLKDEYLEDKNLIDDIVLEDSKNKEFYGLNDGSFVEIIDGTTKIYGETYLIKDGKIEKICSDEEIIEL